MKPTRIILHHSLTADSDTVSWNAIRMYHMRRLLWDDIGYHYGLELIGQHYEILTGRMMNKRGAHARGHNSNSLGICFIGNFDLRQPLKQQWNLGIKLVKSLMEVLNIDIDNIHGHCDYADKSCPGKFFDMDKFKQEVS